MTNNYWINYILSVIALVGWLMGLTVAILGGGLALGAI
tara:strand:+ start:683 stop:796 length:114 start_codon:yes stop_codon:yes gene_type:complete